MKSKNIQSNRGVNVDVNLLHASTESMSKQQFAADRPANLEGEVDLRERMAQLEEALEDNIKHLDKIIFLMKKKEPLAYSSTEDDKVILKKIGSPKTKLRIRVLLCRRHHT